MQRSSLAKQLGIELIKDDLTITDVFGPKELMDLAEREKVAANRGPDDSISEDDGDGKKIMVRFKKPIAK